MMHFHVDELAIYDHGVTFCLIRQYFPIYSFVENEATNVDRRRDKKKYLTVKSQKNAEEFLQPQSME